MTCKNCKSSLNHEQLFCGNCAAKVVTERITIKKLLSDLASNVFGWDNKFFFTVRMLILKPEILFKEYIDGTRKKYMNPLSLLTLTAALALGVKCLHQVRIDCAAVAKYYLSGLLMISSAISRFSVVASISSRPTEALGVCVLEDDRAVRNISTYGGILQDEIDWMHNLSWPVWHLFELASFHLALAVQSEPIVWTVLTPLVLTLTSTFGLGALSALELSYW